MKRLGILLALAFTACRPSVEQCQTIHFTIPQDGLVTLRIEDADGNIVRTLAADQQMQKGRHSILWDGRRDFGETVPAGEYFWKGVARGNIALKLRGWACHSGEVPWDTDDPRRGWAGEVGVPTAVGADAERVYLGWSRPVGSAGVKSDGYFVLACDLDGHVLWGAKLPDFTGCEALAVDGGVVTVLARKADESDILFRFRAGDGSAIPWPSGDGLAVESLWATDASVKPVRARGMITRAGRLYLTFPQEQFLAVLDAGTGAYLQTVVGGAPELIDVVPTQTESPDHPGVLIPADFAMVSLRGGVLGKVLFAHDPLWVITSDFQPLDREEHITALTVLGDAAPHHKHSAFVALGAPFYQVQRRAILASEGFLWSAGQTGGRRDRGPWQPEALGQISGVALDARGRLWIAEDDVITPRFSVWETDGREGRLVRELFGPIPEGATGHGVATLPSDPAIIVGNGCEWRIDPATGRAACLGIIDPKPICFAQFRTASDGRVELEVDHHGLETSIFERRGPGDYVLKSTIPQPGNEDRDDPRILRQGTRIAGTAKLPANRGNIEVRPQSGTWSVVLGGFGQVTSFFEDEPQKVRWPARAEPGADMTRARSPFVCSVSQAADGRVFLAARQTALWNLEITGLESIVPIPGGKLVIQGAPSQRAGQQ